MNYRDIVYGEFKITEPVILELINCSAMQRLKDIDQAGYPPLWAKPALSSYEKSYNRFVHSLGVYLLLYIFKAPLEEQIAGLIHDVSHSAFSHCVDYVLAEGKEAEQSHQDNVFDPYARKTEIPDILKKYGLDIDYILDDKNFPLKEKPLPDLCADRIDYSLKTAVVFGEINAREAEYYLNSLTVADGVWFFKDFIIAKKYAELFLKLNREIYAGLPTAIMFRCVGDCLKYSLRRGYITEHDLYQTDKNVIEKIKNNIKHGRRLGELWARMNNKPDVINDPGDFQLSIYVKSRAVDPCFYDQGAIKRVSEKDGEWGGIVENELKPKQYFLKFK